MQMIEFGGVVAMPLWVALCLGVIAWYSFAGVLLSMFPWLCWFYVDEREPHGDMAQFFVMSPMVLPLSFLVLGAALFFAVFAYVFSFGSICVWKDASK